MYIWEPGTTNAIEFVMVDSTGVEVAGLGATFAIELRQPGGSFVAGTGVKSEIGNGWYSYVAPSGECPASGNVAIRVTGAGCMQQNLVAQASSVDAKLDGIKLVTDTLDVSAVTQVAANIAGHLTITAGLTFDEAVTGLTIPADWVTAIWTLKHSELQADTAAVIQLRVSNPADAEGDGLQRLNGAAVTTPFTAADGTLTVTQASGRIDIYLTDELTALLSRTSGLGWDVKFIDADDDSSGTRGTADVVLTETKAMA